MNEAKHTHVEKTVQRVILRLGNARLLEQAQDSSIPQRRFINLSCQRTPSSAQWRDTHKQGNVYNRHQNHNMKIQFPSDLCLPLWCQRPKLMAMVLDNTQGDVRITLIDRPSLTMSSGSSLRRLFAIHAAVDWDFS